MSKRLPVHAADRLFAVVLFLTSTQVREETFVLEESVSSSGPLSHEVREARVAERVAEMGAHLRTLRDTFVSPIAFIETTLVLSSVRIASQR